MSDEIIYADRVWVLTMSVSLDKLSLTEKDHMLCNFIDVFPVA